MTSPRSKYQRFFATELAHETFPLLTESILAFVRARLTVSICHNLIEFPIEGQSNMKTWHLKLVFLASLLPAFAVSANTERPKPPFEVDESGETVLKCNDMRLSACSDMCRGLWDDLDISDLEGELENGEPSKRPAAFEACIQKCFDRWCRKVSTNPSPWGPRPEVR